MYSNTSRTTTNKRYYTSCVFFFFCKTLSSTEIFNCIFFSSGISCVSGIHTFFGTYIPVYVLSRRYISIGRVFKYYWTRVPKHIWRYGARKWWTDRTLALDSWHTNSHFVLQKKMFTKYNSKYSTRGYIKSRRTKTVGKPSTEKRTTPYRSGAGSGGRTAARYWPSVVFPSRTAY